MTHSLPCPRLRNSAVEQSAVESHWAAPAPREYSGPTGWVQREGGPVEEIRPGDVVWFAPGEKHWHGATSSAGMTHIAIQEKHDHKVVDWMDPVTDEQYRK